MPWVEEQREGSGMKGGAVRSGQEQEGGQAGGQEGGRWQDISNQ